MQRNPKPCAVGSCLNYLFGMCCLVLMTLLVKNTIKWLIGWCAVKDRLMLISRFCFIYQHGSELGQESTHFKMFVCIFKPLFICSRVICIHFPLFHFLDKFSLVFLDNIYPGHICVHLVHSFSVYFILDLIVFHFKSFNSLVYKPENPICHQPLGVCTSMENSHLFEKCSRILWNSRVENNKSERNFWFLNKRVCHLAYLNRIWVVLILF